MNYTIQSGDTLSALAAKYGTSMQDILKLNPSITDPNKIYAGAMLNLPGVSSPALPSASPAPGTGSAYTPPDPYKSLAQNAGMAGMGLGDLSTLLGGQTDDTSLRNNLAGTFGYQDYNAFLQDIFAKPSKTTQQYYQEAYNAAGLGDLLSKITARKNDLSQAEFAVNDNPWLSEASRSGRTRRLQELANSEISNWQESYNTGLDRVRDLVGMYSTDLGNDERIKEMRFKYLLEETERVAGKEAADRLGKYLPEYLEGKNSGPSEAPKTVAFGDKLYAWNGATGEFELMATKPPGSGSTNKGTTGASYDSRIKEEINNIYSGRYGKEGAREKAIEILEREFPGKDVAADIYSRAPDGFTVKGGGLGYDDF